MPGLHFYFSPLRRNFNSSSNFPMNSEETVFKDIIIYWLWNAKVPYETLLRFSQCLFFQDGFKKHWWAPNSIISDSALSVQNSSIRNKHSPGSWYIQQIPKIQWAITWPSVPWYLNSIANSTLVPTKTSARVSIIWDKWEKVLTPLSDGWCKRIGLFCISHGEEQHVRNIQAGSDLFATCPVT